MLALAAPVSAPAGWRSARIPTGATLHYPPAWHPSRGDAGTATAVLRDGRRSIVGYLNITPRQGAETMSDWASFRVAHNSREGDRDVRGEALARHVPFTSASGTCVRDSYRTAANTSYVEIACLAQGAHASTVIVAAASSSRWAALSPLLYRAIAAFTT